MELIQQQRNRANILHGFLKKQSLEYFQETGISTCNNCYATGLRVNRSLSGDFSWDTANFCKECNGIGYKGLSGGMQIDLINFICKRCDGIGCDKCNHKGIVDWVTNIMG